MNTLETNTKSRQMVMACLAVVGFIALVGAGVWLAIYSTRFVPEIVNGTGEAVVYLGSILIPHHNSGISVVQTPTASTTISFGTTDSTSSPESTPKKVVTTAGTETGGVYQIGGTTESVLSGLPDLIVTIDATGYLATSSASSFVAASTIPSGVRPAVSFTIKNVGTNVSGAWRFSASIPTIWRSINRSYSNRLIRATASITSSDLIRQIRVNETVSITANPDHLISESNTNNDSASAEMTILGN